MDRGAWWAIVHRVAKSQTQLKQLSTHTQAWASQVALVVQSPPANAGDVRDMGLIPRLERSPGGGHGNPLQYSCLENPMERGAWQATVCEVAKSWTQLKRLSMHTHTLLIVIPLTPIHLPALDPRRPPSRIC